MWAWKKINGIRYKLYLCRYARCDFSSLDIRDVTKHENESHHPEYYECPECDYKINNIPSFVGHLLGVHSYGPDERNSIIKSQRLSLKKGAHAMKNL